MKKYDIYKKSIQINWKNRMDIAPWCTDLDPEPEKLQNLILLKQQEKN